MEKAKDSISPNLSFGTPTNNGLSGPPSPLAAPATPSNEEKTKDFSFSPPYPSPEPGTPLPQENEANEGQVLIPTQPSIFEPKAKAKQRQRGETSPTILVPNLSDTMRQSALDTKNRNE